MNMNMHPLPPAAQRFLDDFATADADIGLADRAREAAVACRDAALVGLTELGLTPGRVVRAVNNRVSQSTVRNAQRAAATAHHTAGNGV